MTLRLRAASEYEAYFDSIANANWNTHYLTSEGELKKKVFCFALPCIFSQPNIENAIACLHGRVELYNRLDDKGQEFQAKIIGMAQKVNELAEQHAIPEEMKFQIEGLRARWLGQRSGQNVTPGRIPGGRTSGVHPPSLESSQLMSSSVIAQLSKSSSPYHS